MSNSKFMQYELPAANWASKLGLATIAPHNRRSPQQVQKSFSERADYEVNS